MPTANGLGRAAAREQKCQRKQSEIWRFLVDIFHTSGLSHIWCYLAIIWSKYSHLGLKAAHVWLFVCCGAGLISICVNSSQCFLPFPYFTWSNQSASHFFLPSSLFPHISLDRTATTPRFSAISPAPSLGEASLLSQSTPGSDQCFFSRSLLVRRAEPLGATGSHACSISPSPQNQPTNISN